MRVLGYLPLVSREERFWRVEGDGNVDDDLRCSRGDNDVRPEDGTGKDLFDCSAVSRFSDHLDRLLQDNVVTTPNGRKTVSTVTDNMQGGLGSLLVSAEFAVRRGEASSS